MFSNVYIKALVTVAAAMLVFVVISSLFGSARRAMATAVFKRFSGDVQRVFGSDSDAQSAIHDALTRARQVRILTGHGRAFAKHDFAPLFQLAGAQREKIRILIDAAYRDPSGIDWVAQLERDLAPVVEALGGEPSLRDPIGSRARDLEKLFQEPRVQVRAYGLSDLGKIVLTEETVFFGPNFEIENVVTGRVFQYTRGGMYDFLSGRFDAAWTESRKLGQLS